MFAELTALQEHHSTAAEREALVEALTARLSGELAAIAPRCPVAIEHHLETARAAVPVLAEQTAHAALDLAAALCPEGTPCGALLLESGELSAVGWPLGKIKGDQGGGEALAELVTAGRLNPPTLPGEALRWALDQLRALENTMPPGAERVAFLDMSEQLGRNTPPRMLQWIDSRGEGRRAWPGLFAAVRSCALRAAWGPGTGGPDRWPAPVNRSPVRVVQTLAGANLGAVLPEHTNTGQHSSVTVPAVRGDESIRDLIVRWDCVEHQTGQLNLSLEADEGMPLWSAIARRYGATASRDIMGMFILSWASDAEKECEWWLYPRELSLLTGTDRDQARQMQRLRKLIADLHRSVLDIDGFKAPVVACTGLTSRRRSPALLLKLHPVLTLGSLGKKQEYMGKYWWPLPVGALKSADGVQAGRLALLSFTLASSWRAAWSPGRTSTKLPHARFRVGRLADSLAIRGRAPGGEIICRRTDRRMAEQLYRVLIAGRKIGLIGGWRLPGAGRVALLGAELVEKMATNPGLTLELWPGPLASPVPGLLARPSWIPSTGEDLMRWLHVHRWTARQAAKELTGTSRQTIDRALKSRGLAIPSTLRTAIRAWSWGESWR